MRKLIGFFGLAVTMLLSACGGGGGSPGTTIEAYSVSLRADKTSLPLNVGLYPFGPGVNFPFTTVVNVNATVNGRPIPGREEDDGFECRVVEGLNSGALAYTDGTPDGDEEHDGLWVSITLGVNSGGAAFRFHARDQAGPARVLCSILNPDDGIEYSASTVITVGGGAGTGRPASLYMNTTNTSSRGYLGSQQNINNIPNNIGITAAVMDDAVQPVPDPVAANVQVRILTTGSAAEIGARLISGTQSGNQVQLRTIAGVAQFSLSSGPARGVILLELAADRLDNNVTNGLQDPIIQWAAIPVVDGISPPITEIAPTTITMELGVPSVAVLEATGGTPPYTWCAVVGTQCTTGALSVTGLSLSADGVIGGTPLAQPGSYVVRVRVTDVNGFSAEANVTIVIEAQDALELEAADIDATAGVPFSFVLQATGGLPPYKWTGSLPTGVDIDEDTGVISGTIATAGTYLAVVTVTDSLGASASANLTITVEAP
jgi:hypothetical protein